MGGGFVEGVGGIAGIGWEWAREGMVGILIWVVVDSMLFGRW